jgi:hypothetical protein
MCVVTLYHYPIYCQGLGGGPYGDPRRWDGSPETAYNQDNLTLTEQKAGGFERAVSMFRTSYSQISVRRLCLRMVGWEGGKGEGRRRKEISVG